MTKMHCCGIVGRRASLSAKHLILRPTFPLQRQRHWYELTAAPYLLRLKNASMLQVQIAPPSLFCPTLFARKQAELQGRQLSPGTATFGKKLETTQGNPDSCHTAFSTPSSRIGRALVSRDGKTTDCERIFCRAAEAVPGSPCRVAVVGRKPHPVVPSHSQQNIREM